jgi:hypothetical protein
MDKYISTEDLDKFADFTLIFGTHEDKIPRLLLLRSTNVLDLIASDPNVNSYTFVGVAAMETMGYERAAHVFKTLIRPLLCDMRNLVTDRSELRTGILEEFSEDIMNLYILMDYFGADINHDEDPLIDVLREMISDNLPNDSYDDGGVRDLIQKLDTIQFGIDMLDKIKKLSKYRS